MVGQPDASGNPYASPPDTADEVPSTAGDSSGIHRGTMVIYVLVYGGVAAVLLFSPSVREFLNGQLDGSSDLGPGRE